MTEGSLERGVTHPYDTGSSALGLRRAQIVNFKTNCVFSQEEFCQLYTVQHSSFIHCVRFKIPYGITHAQLQSGHGGILMCNYARLYCTLMIAERYSALFSVNSELYYRRSL